jgi:hypothetical protein
MKRTYHLHAADVTADVSPSTKPPGGATFRVYEILARDPETSLGRYCSAMVQQTAEIIRYEVEVDLVNDEDDLDLNEWQGNLEVDLMAEVNNAEMWFGSSTFDDWPHAVVEVEVDDTDLEGVDPTSWEYDKKFLDRLYEDEANMTAVPRPTTTAPTGASES